MEQQRSISALIAYCALLLSEKLIGALPTSLVWRAGSAIGITLCFLTKKRREIVAHNLRMVHPDKSAKDISSLTKKVFRYSFANLLSSVNTSTITGRKISKNLAVRGIENIEDIGSDQGAILLLFHMGNWEILTRMQEIIPNNNPIGGIYRPLKNPYIDAHVKKQREASGSRLFSRKKGVIEAHKFLKTGGFLGILCDQWAGRAGLKTNLFGKQSSITPLPAILALKHQCPIIPVSLETISPGRWEMGFHEPIRLSPELDKVDATNELVNTMENIMRNYSKDIFWLHDRWKINPRKRRKRQPS
jgi:lauroyl/myristoyl acyltransferase